MDLVPAPAQADSRRPPRDGRATPDAARWLDGVLHAAQGHASGGLSPIAQGLALFDWGVHLANAPYRRAELARLGVETAADMARAAHGVEVIAPAPGDHRFRDPEWRQDPYRYWMQAFLLGERWWAEATDGPPGVAESDRRVVAFGVRQWIDMFSPSNAPWLNPEVLRATRLTGGTNLLRGAANALADAQAGARGATAETPFQIGRDIAATPGAVVFRNDLIELLQYSPTTGEVAREPVLVISAWIMKYYILDLQSEDSLIRWLVGRGHTVFVISWRNPGAEFRDASLEDYRRQGLNAALDVVSEICRGEKIQAVGYCLGGTLLSIGAAALARDGDTRLAGVTLFCAQTDFTEAGELQLFITADQLAFLDDVMRAQGYLDASQMAGAFQFLRSNDLFWSRLLKSYWLGEREHPSDLMQWNADATRMPARMHSEYLHKLFQRNELAEGRYDAGGQPIALADIRAPMFVVGTETDHIAPWRSVYKIHLLNDSDITFVLTSGGHNAGVVSPPGPPGRHYLKLKRPRGGRYLGPDQWLNAAEPHEGSWWPAWGEWLDETSNGRVAARPLGSVQHPAAEPAPGLYILQK